MRLVTYFSCSSAASNGSRKFLDWFIEEQQEEEDNADKMITRMKLFGSDAKALYDLDQENAARVYSCLLYTSHFVVHDLVGQAHAADVLLVGVGRLRRDRARAQIDAEDLTGPSIRLSPIHISSATRFCV